MAAVWTFLNSGLFQGLAITLVGLIWKKTVTNQDRRAQLLHYADDMFNVVEVIGKQKGLEGVQKYNLFIQNIVNHLKEEKKPELSAAEVGMLQNLAFRKSWLKKSADKAIPVTMKKE
jgi:ketosteroid isomerase-like protein